ncbi:MAG: endonuclease [Candidatus Marinimicrobia bacterium CG_4_10_14_0_2_um_filter_48_9]|nr:MAG: endonuclease [Candidatus Marinimicrobia bacterium CG_4_10_14_0_2_um_filter_48_9]PJA51617.1 MAG: endonuclease [Candidatus Marinimicrobia bacterium CG_4_9_14_3_um_filter_48_9]
MKQGYVYIMSNHSRSTLYIGVTSNLERRILEHKSSTGSKFTTHYHLTDLLYYEPVEGMENAIRREKQLKAWHREWKWTLINAENPDLKDLSVGWFTEKEIQEYSRNANGPSP